MNKHKNCWSNYTTIDQLIELDRKETINRKFRAVFNRFQGFLLIIYIIVSVLITMSL